MTDINDEPLPESVRNALLEAIEPAFPPPTRVQAIKERLMERVAAERGSSPKDAAGLITVKASDGEWKRFLPKVAIKVLRREADTLTYLLRLEPGAALLPHEHPQDEECIVLDGEARIGDLTVRAGDYHCAPAGRPHGVIRSETGATLFLRGAIPSANQVRWLSRDTLTALTPQGVRNLFDRG
ncbi:MAG: cupin domain-containing protein [Rhodocyclaceae bacterium]